MVALLSKQQKKAKTPLVIEGIPGTFTHGFKELPIERLRLGLDLQEALAWRGIDPEEIDMRRFSMGPCNILVGREPAAADGSALWHLTISTPSRHPTWDEIKIARYRLLPLDLCFGMLLPQPDLYVNVPQQDHVFHLWEVLDPREPWTTG